MPLCALLICAAAGGWERSRALASAAVMPPSGSLRVVTLATQSMSIDQAVRMAEQRYHARVVKAETESDKGRTVYVLRLLNDAGRVWTVRVDATNGSVL